MFNQSTPILGVENCPLEKVVIPENCHPPSALSSTGTPRPNRFPLPNGSSQTKLNTSRCGTSKLLWPLSKILNADPVAENSSVEPRSSDFCQVYEVRKYSPELNRFSNR